MADKTWCGHVPTSTCPQARLYAFIYLSISKGKPGFDYTIRTEFKKNAVALERTDVLMIEHLMRNGKRKLEMIQDPNVSGMGQFVKDKDE